MPFHPALRRPARRAGPGFAAALCGLAAGAALACEEVPLEAPAAGQSVSLERPELRWPGDAAGTYRLQLAVVLPESRLLASYDVEVAGTRWALPAPVPAARAAVKVLVSRACPRLEAQDLHTRGPAFFIDLRAGCALDQASLRVAPQGLAWGAVPGAQSYQVRLFRPAAQAGEPWSMPAQLATDEPRALLPSAARPGDVASVQPVCGGRGGPAVSVVLR